MSFKKVLITGSHGYIGSVLTSKLLDRKYDILGIDTLFFQNSLLVKRVGFPFLKKDIRSINENDLNGIDAVIHLAALSTDFLEVLKNETDDINHQATVKLAKKCKKMGVKRFIYSSSCSVYGIGTSTIVNEESQTNPITTYGKSKVDSEKDLRKLADDNFTVILPRYSTVYGFSPAFRDDLIVNQYTASALVLKKIKVVGNPMRWRPIVDIEDLSEILIRLLEIPSRRINREIINIGFNETNTQLTTLVNTIRKIFPECKIIFSKDSNIDLRDYKVNFDKMHRLISDYKKQRTIEKSIKDIAINLKINGYTRNDYLKRTFSRQDSLRKLLKNEVLTDKLFWKKA